MRTVIYRVVHLAAVLLGVSVFTFLLLQLLPGDPALAIVSGSGSADPADVERVRRELGLDLPLWQQYVDWLFSALRGDLGSSYRNGQSVVAAIGERLPVTVHLVLMVQVVSLLIALPIALYVAPRRDRPIDRAVAALSFGFQSIPNYVIALVAVLVLSVSLGVLPAIGYVPISEGFWPSTRSLIIPTIAISAVLIPVYIRVLRSSAIQTLQMDFMLVGKSIGMSRSTLMYRFALKPSLPPLITVIGINFGVLIGASVIVEVICGIPGMGTLLLSAVNTWDYVMVQGIVLVFALAYVLANFAVDLIQLAIDPRVRA